MEITFDVGYFVAAGAGEVVPFLTVPRSVSDFLIGAVNLSNAGAVGDADARHFMEWAKIGNGSRRSPIVRTICRRRLNRATENATSPIAGGARVTETYPRRRVVETFDVLVSPGDWIGSFVDMTYVTFGEGGVNARGYGELVMNAPNQYEVRIRSLKVTLPSGFQYAC